MSQDTLKFSPYSVEESSIICGDIHLIFFFNCKAALGFCAVPGFFSSCGAYSLVVVRGFLIAVTSFVTEREL